MPNCGWKGTTALTLTGLTFTGLSIAGVLYLQTAAREQCESQLQSVIDDILNRTIDTPAIDENITFPITIPSTEINEYSYLPSYTFNVTVPINIPAISLPLAMFLGNSTIESLEDLPKQLGNICADQMTMHTSSYAAIIIMFFLFVTLIYAIASSLQRQINKLEENLDRAGRHAVNELSGLLRPRHLKQHSV